MENQRREGTDIPPAYEHGFAIRCLRMDRYQLENFRHLLELTKERALEPPAGVDQEWAWLVRHRADQLLYLLEK